MCDFRFFCGSPKRSFNALFHVLQTSNSEPQQQQQQPNGHHHQAEEAFKVHKRDQVFERGKGVWLYPLIETAANDEGQGHEGYLDLVSSVAHVGHANSKVNKAIKEAAQSDIPLINPRATTSFIETPFTISIDHQQQEVTKVDPNQPSTSSSSSSPVMKKKVV